jgi:hypothetical protein
VSCNRETLTVARSVSLRGNPVIGGLSGTPGHVTITPVYWAPAGYSYPPPKKVYHQHALGVNGYLSRPSRLAVRPRPTPFCFTIASQEVVPWASSTACPAAMARKSAV